MVLHRINQRIYVNIGFAFTQQNVHLVYTVPNSLFNSRVIRSVFNNLLFGLFSLCYFRLKFVQEVEPMLLQEMFNKVNLKKAFTISWALVSLNIFVSLF